MKAILQILLMSLSCYGSQQLYDQLCERNYNGFLRHPEECHKFIRCSHQRAYVFHCPADLLWHHEIESCDYSYRTQCIVKELKNGDRKSEATVMGENFEVYKEKSDSKTSKRPDNLSSGKVNVMKENLPYNVKNFTEQKLTPSIKRNFTAKFYYVKKITKKPTISYASTQNSGENYNTTLLEESTVSADAVKLTDVILKGLTESAIENIRDSDDDSNLKENNPQKANNIIVTAASCSKNNNKLKNTKATVAVNVTETILTDFPKGATEISKNLNSSSAYYNSTLLTDAAFVINTTETQQAVQETEAIVFKNSSNNLNLTEFEAVKVTEEYNTTSVLTNSLYSVNLTENSSVNTIKVLESQNSPVKCSCLTGSHLKVLTEDAAAITDSSVNVSEPTERVVDKTKEIELGNVIEILEKPFKAEVLMNEKKSSSVATDNPLNLKSSIESSTTTDLEQEVSYLNSPTKPVKITIIESVTTSLTTENSDITDIYPVLSTTESLNSNNNSKKTTDIGVIKAENFTESLYLTTKDHGNRTDSNALNTTSSMLTEIASAVITELERENTTLTTFLDNSLNLTENDENFTVGVKYSHQYNDFPDNIYLTESIIVTESYNSNNLSEDLTEKVYNYSGHNNSDILIYSNLTGNSSIKVTVKPNVNLTANVENLLNSSNSTENSPKINNSVLLIDTSLTDNITVKLTVKPNVNLTENTKNPHNAFNLTDNFKQTNNNVNLTYFNLTDNFPVKLNVNLTVTTENPSNSFNLTEFTPTINNSVIAIDSYVTDSIPVKPIVKPNVNLAIKAENTTNTFNSNAVNSIITESTNDFPYIYNLTEKSPDIIDITVNLTEKVTKHNGSTVNSLNKTENSIEYVTKSFIETTNIDTVTQFTVNLTFEETDANINALNSTESFTALQTEYNNSNILTDLSVNITNESSTVPTTTEVTLTELTKELLNLHNLTESSTATHNTNRLTENSLQNVSKDTITELITEIILTESTNNLVNSFNLTETFTEPTDNRNISIDFIVNLTQQETVDKATNVSFYNLTENTLHNLSKDKISDFSVTVNETTEKFNNFFNLENVTEPKQYTVNSYNLTENVEENVTQDMLEVSTVKMTFETNRTNREILDNTVNVTDKLFTEDSVKTTDNADNFTEQLFKEVSVKTNVDEKKNVTVTATVSEYNSVKIENVTDAKITEKSLEIADETNKNSVNIKEILKTMLTEETVKTTKKDDNKLNRFSIETTPVSKEYKQNARETVKTVNIENVTESMLKEETVNDVNNALSNSIIETTTVTKQNITATETVNNEAEHSFNIENVTESMLKEETVNTVNVTDKVFTEASVKITDNVDNFTEQLFKEVSVKTNVEEKKNVTVTATVSEYNENSVKIENVTDAIITEEAVKIAYPTEENSVTVKEIIKTILTEETVKTTNEDDNKLNRYSIITTPVSKEYTAANETVKTVNIENVTESMLKEETTTVTKQNITATETINNKVEHSVKNVTEPMITEETIKITEDIHNNVNNFSMQTTSFPKEKITPTETLKTKDEHSVNMESITVTMLTEGTVKITENYDNISKQYTAEINPIIKNNTATTPSTLKEESTITESSVTEYVTNIVNHYPNKTTTVIKENLNTMKTNILEENLTENSPKNVTNIMVISNLTESPNNTQYPSISSPINLITKILKYTQAQRESTTLAAPTTSQELYVVDITTIDPRLPFRSIECVGSNNRRQFQAYECYQYYQCFAGWAFLLNCREGWRFEVTEGQCIFDVNNECEL